MAPDHIEIKKNKRKRGAQPGNLNAFRHGFYSKLFKPLNAEDLEGIFSTSLEEEIAMLRVATQWTFNLANQVVPPGCSNLKRNLVMEIKPYLP
jgi:hypothetical protein